MTQMHAIEMCNQVDDEFEIVQEMFGEDFLELADLFKRDTPKRMSDLDHAIKTLDIEKVKNLAHILGGSACSMGAIKLSQLCKSLEEKSKAGGLEKFDDALDAIRNEYHRIEAKLIKMTLSHPT